MCKFVFSAGITLLMLGFAALLLDVQALSGQGAWPARTIFQWLELLNLPLLRGGPDALGDLVGWFLRLPLSYTFFGFGILAAIAGALCVERGD